MIRGYKILSLLAVLAMVSGIYATEILKVSVGGAPGLGIGTVVRLSGDDAVTACNEGQRPLGVIVLYEDFGGSTYYLVSSSNITERVLCSAPVIAGERLVPADGGAIQPLSADPDGYILGVALENASAGSRTKIMIEIAENSGLGEANQTITTGAGLTGAELGTTGDLTIDVGAGWGISTTATAVSVNQTTLDGRYLQTEADGVIGNEVVTGLSFVGGNLNLTQNAGTSPISVSLDGRYLQTEADGVIGNEVTNATAGNSGLVRSGSGTSGSPYTLAMGTPSDVNSSSTNSLSGSNHTHALSNSGVTAGTYNYLTVNAKGIVTSASNQPYMTSYSEADPEVGSNTTNYVPKWNGSALVTGSIYDNGNIGIGTNSPGRRLTSVHSTSGSSMQGAGSFSIDWTYASSQALALTANASKSSGEDSGRSTGLYALGGNATDRWNTGISAVLWGSKHGAAIVAGTYNDYITYGYVSDYQPQYVAPAGQWGIVSYSPVYFHQALNIAGITTTTGGLVIETRTSDPASPANGRIWLRVD